MTCAGDEIGWDFVQSVLRFKTSFSGYCAEMTRRYITAMDNAPHFMSPNTFINWFFAWLASMKIDFRKHIDPQCGHDPPMLACDGTHIGVSIMNMELERTVTGIDLDKEIKPKHKRLDRLLICDKTTRKHLRYMCNKKLSKLPEDEILTLEQENRKTQDMLRHIQTKNAPIVHEFIQLFLSGNKEDVFNNWMAKLLHMLSGDPPIESVVPFTSHGDILTACVQLQAHNYNVQLLDDLRRHCVEIAKLLHYSWSNGTLQTVTQFIQHLVELVIEVHVNDLDPIQPQVIPGTYYPPSGVAYYFSPTGEQLRKLPKYKVVKTSKTPNFDDNPLVDKQCTKNYPGVSHGGYGYMFVYFCPIHGHSYGFHLINGSEGRKDAFAALYKYKEKMPQHLFYDFACQLSEYCLNREPQLFADTKFWHDLFHSITHVCGKNFKSVRIEGLEGINTEICEQFNGFLQCIKYTGSHLSQEHFMFFVQFFLYIFNKQKSEKFRKMAILAFACQQ